MISFSTAAEKFLLRDKNRLKAWIVATIKAYKRTAGDISFVFCDDDYLLTINKQYLQHDTLTDIITFDYSESATGAVSGDVFISVERVRENAQKFSRPFTEELHRVMIHGILHLLGHTDKKKSEKEKMTAAEDLALRKLSQQK